jgi:hypothetical protein
MPMIVQFALYWLVTIVASAALWFIAERCCTKWMKAIVVKPKRVIASASVEPPGGGLTGQ